MKTARKIIASAAFSPRRVYYTNNAPHFASARPLPKSAKSSSDAKLCFISAAPDSASWTARAIGKTQKHATLIDERGERGRSVTDAILQTSPV